jgi:predicted enzyme related to lactoylglutathione lyase
MARVTGIGGVFLRSSNPKGLAAWYAEHLGVVLSPWGGANFEWSDEVPKGTGSTAWNVFPHDTEYFGDDPRPVMINYRVDDLETLLTELAAKGVWIDPKRDSGDFGHFAWVKDSDGNRIELWQPLAEEADK